MFDMVRWTGTLDNESILGLLVLLGVVLYSLVLLLKRWARGTRPPDPWDAETSTRLEDPALPVLCHRCLVPNDPNADFCENCGAAVGQYTNYFPPPCIFSLGHTLRLGTAGDFKRSPLTVCGYVLLALAAYKVFAPVYLYFFFRNMPKKMHLPEPHPPK